MYKLETHLHVAGTSPCAQTEEKFIAEIYKKEGYNGIVYTSHYNSFLCGYYGFKNFGGYNDNFLRHFETLKKECSAFGIDVFFGMEFMPDETSYYEPTPMNAEFLIFGATEEILKDGETLLKKGVKYTKDYCSERDFLFGQAHPFRDMITYRHPEFLDCAEAINGNPRQQSHNDKARVYAEQNGLILTAGSDFHEPQDCLAGVYLESEVKTGRELVCELKKRRHTLFFNG